MKGDTSLIMGHIYKDFKRYNHYEMVLSSYYLIRKQLNTQYIKLDDILKENYVGWIVIHRFRVGIIINSSQAVDLGKNYKCPQIIICSLKTFFVQSSGVILINPLSLADELPQIIRRAQFFALQGRAYDITQYHPLVFMAQEILGDKKYINEFKGLIKFMKSPSLYNWRPYLRCYNIKVYIINDKIRRLG